MGIMNYSTMNTVKVCTVIVVFIQVIIWKETSNGWAKLQEFCNHDSSGKAKRFQKILQMFIL